MIEKLFFSQSDNFHKWFTFLGLLLVLAAWVGPSYITHKLGDDIRRSRTRMINEVTIRQDKIDQRVAQGENPKTSPRIAELQQEIQESTAYWNGETAKGDKLAQNVTIIGYWGLGPVGLALFIFGGRRWYRQDHRRQHAQSVREAAEIAFQRQQTATSALEAEKLQFEVEAMRAAQNPADPVILSLPAVAKAG